METQILRARSSQKAEPVPIPLIYIIKIPDFLKLHLRLETQIFRTRKLPEVDKTVGKIVMKYNIKK